MDKKHILDRLDIKSFYVSELDGIKWNGSGMAQALCCFHEDTNPSLSVNLSNGSFRCFGCDTKGSLFDFYMRRHGVDYKTALNALAEKAGIAAETQRKVTGTYDYTDKDGNLLFQVLRYTPKGFNQRRPDPDNEGKWIYNLKGISFTLYNFRQVIKAESVLIVEGEKDADNLKAIGLTASCNPQGANKWKPEYNQYFRGKKVYILPDNDKPGREHAQAVAKHLKGVASSVKVIDLPGLKEKQDVSDWTQARQAEGKTAEEIRIELQGLIDACPEWTPQEPKSLLESLLKWNDILTLDVSTEYLLDKLIPKNSITLLFGRGGIGKTSLCMQIGKAIASGELLDTLQTIETPVYYIDFENPLAVLKERVEKIGQSDNLFVWHISNEIQPPKLDGSEWELYKQLPAGLLIVDTLRASHLSDENDSKPMSLIMGRLKELREAGFTILLLHHTPKGNENTFKGSTALLDLCDHVLGLEEVKGQEGDNIEFDCENLYKLGTRIKTRYEPHSIYLTFKPEIKGFEVAKDPDLEKLRDIWELLNNSKQTPNQTAFRELIKKELDFTDHEARRLIRKGEGLYWQKTKSGGGKGHRAFCYVVMSDPYIAHISTQQQNTTPFSSDTTSSKDTPQTLDNSHLLLCQEGVYHNNITSSDVVSDHDKNMERAYHNKIDLDELLKDAVVISEPGEAVQ